MLARHAGASAGPRGPERSLLTDQLAALDAALEPGLARLNWSSLTIGDFAAAVNKVWRRRGQWRGVAEAGSGAGPAARGHQRSHCRLAEQGPSDPNHPPGCPRAPMPLACPGGGPV